LTIRRVRPTDIRAFVPIQPEPFQVGDELIFETDFAAFDIRVFNAQHHGAAVPPREEPVEQSRACVTDVEMTRGRRRKTNPDRRIRSHQKMLAERGGGQKS
jgi:hypothetical protein